MKQALNILIAYLTCTDPVIQNKWNNLLHSYWHKDSGWLLKSITAQAGGYKFTIVDGDGNDVDHIINIPTIPNSQPISYIQDLQTTLDNKVDKVAGKGLSTNDFTTTLKNKLDGLANYVHAEFHQISEIEGLQGLLDTFAVYENLAEVAKTNNYEDLDGKPVFKVVQNEYADMAALYAGQGNQTESSIQYVIDANAHTEVESGGAYFEYFGTTNGDETDYRLLSDVESSALANQIQRLSDLIDDIGAKDGTLPLSLLVDGTNGDDSSAVLENFSKPFKTLNAALSALPVTNGETYNIYLAGGNYNLTEQIDYRNLNFIAYKASTINFSNVLDGTGAVPSNPFKGTPNFKTLSFEGGLISIINTNASIRFGASGNNRIILKGYLNQVSWSGSAAGSGNGAFFLSQETYVRIKKMSIVGSGEFLSGNQSGSPKDIYIEIDELEYVDNRDWAVGVVGTFDIKKITQFDQSSSETYLLRSRYSISACIYKIGDINIKGVVDIQGKETYFNSSILSSTSNIRISGIVGGTIHSSNYLGSGSNADSLVLDGFNGKLVELRLTNGNPIIRNSNITTNGSLFTGTENTTNNITVEGSCTIFQNNLSANLFLTYSYGNLNYPNVMNLIIKGSLSSNVKDYGYKVNYENQTATLKEKLKERIVRSKRDLLYKTLDSSLTYIIDGEIELLAGEYIEVPAGGNITINGYGLEASKITKAVAGESIFSSPVGGSGGLQMQGLKLDGGGLSSCFDLVDETGNNAIEINVVNLENFADLGELNDYRQFLGTTIGIYGCSDGLTLSGTWNGFKITNTNCFGFGSTGTLFKEGTTLLFNDRMYLDVNINLPTGAELVNLDNANFGSTGLLQINNSYVKLNSTVDASINTPLLIPNIAPNDSKCLWANNLGITNTILMPSGINTGNLSSYADDTAAAGGGIEIGEVYINSSNGALQSRLT